MAISQEKQEALLRRMEKLAVKEDELVEKFILGSGSGGQKVNKTSSSVYLKHTPSGIEIKCQRYRSRELNRYYARKELCERLEEILFKEKSKKKQEAAKIRKQKKRRSRRVRAKILEDKRQHSEKKQMRKPPKINDNS